MTSDLRRLAVPVLRQLLARLNAAILTRSASLARAAVVRELVRRRAA